MAKKKPEHIIIGTCRGCQSILYLGDRTCPQCGNPCGDSVDQDHLDDINAMMMEPDPAPVHVSYPGGYAAIAVSSDPYPDFACYSTSSTMEFEQHLRVATTNGVFPYEPPAVVGSSQDMGTTNDEDDEDYDDDEDDEEPKAEPWFDKDGYYRTGPKPAEVPKKEGGFKAALKKSWKWWAHPHIVRTGE